MIDWATVEAQRARGERITVERDELRLGDRFVTSDGWRTIVAIRHDGFELDNGNLLHVDPGTTIEVQPSTMVRADLLGPGDRVLVARLFREPGGVRTVGLVIPDGHRVRIAWADHDVDSWFLPTDRVTVLTPRPASRRYGHLVAAWAEYQWRIRLHAAAPTGETFAAMARAQHIYESLSRFRWDLA